MARRKEFLTLLAVALALAGLLFVAGCGEEAAEEPATFGERLQEAEQEDGGVAAEPASFISLCANCHDRLDRELDWRRQRKLIFNHPAHFANGIRCEACHQEFPHKPGRTIHVPVETCFVCHGTLHGRTGELAPTDCATCHTPDIAPVTPDHEDAQWLIAGGSEKALHSQKGSESPLYCKMCHQETFCQNCHQVDMPHPDEWLVEHRPVALEQRDACSRCHESSYCNDCHHDDFERLADWTTQHRRVVVDVGPTDCYECHQETYCAECHVRTGRERGVLGG